MIKYSFLSVDLTLKGIDTPSQSGPRSNGTAEVHNIPQSF